MIKEEVTKPNHYQIKIEGQIIETKDIIKALLSETATVGSVAFWYGNAFKYISRMFKKHDDPVTDLDKTIECLLNIREEYTGERYELTKAEADIDDIDGIDDIDDEAGRVVWAKHLSSSWGDRYIIVDSNDEILDDAQGYGYKSRTKAMNAWRFKGGTIKRW